VTSSGVFNARETGLYAVGSFGTGAFSTVPSVLLLYFCTEIVGIPAGTAALIVFLPKLWTLFWDPFVGGWSDRTVSRFGRRRPFLVCGAVGTGVAFALLFAPPPMAPVGLSLWVGLSYLALVTFYALFAVPYVAFPAEFARTSSDRSRLVGWRMAAAMIGVLAGASGIMSASAPYLIVHALARNEADIGVALGIMLVATSLTAPALAWAGRRWGEAPALTVSILVYVLAAAIVALAARYHHWPAMLAGFALAGPAFAGLQVLPYTMVAHLIHARAAAGVAAEGTLTGMWTAVEKIGLALGPLATALALAMVQRDYAGGLAGFVMLATAALGLLSIPLLRLAGRS
jgi:Na+/melibiose symporter-like transporter